MEKPPFPFKISFEEFLKRERPFKSNFFPGISRKKQIGKGSSGKIYEVSLEDDKENKYAAKEHFSPNHSPNISELSNESMILKSLSDCVGFPKVSRLLRKGENEIMIMTLLGSNLQDLKIQFGGKFSLKTVLMISIQAIKRIETLHEKGFLHRDVKPENFVVGLGDNKNIIHLIDFGLSISYLDDKGKHVIFNDNANIGGTPYFLSSYGHLRLQPSRRDDLISLGYMFISLLNGKLPWHDVKGNFKEKLKTMCRSKVKTSPKDLCIGLPEEFSLYFDYVLKLRFQEKPDYDHLVGIFEKIMLKKGFINDNVFDWNNLKKSTGIDLNVVRMPHEPITKFIKILNESNNDLNFDPKD